MRYVTINKKDKDGATKTTIFDLPELPVQGIKLSPEDFDRDYAKGIGNKKHLIEYASHFGVELDKSKTFNSLLAHLTKTLDT